MNQTPEVHTVAVIDGLGCTYRITTDDGFDRFDVATASGPADKAEASFPAFPDALHYVANQIAADLALEAGEG